ncbi:Monoterpene epsilon-lactone hydrolase (plasmid) [Caballeronia sp. SBC1]|uniref:alpha/beta hydrolase fold domain-containing protein n=1 Tax=unclassified Caballeronia TaxID=2646786 RepID=UPI0013E14A60|nr:MULTISPECIES: alpha/beta hydrolase fold domain-containing protein [unclassified Caballeronia]QIE28324.1 Monoterpene epsilon-lactone hydrolase [Caballeronia sp. SBC2]QIN66381.1 Monoterpene epsilon-lactone hydrolase [Caballeronia sp. SBC1]
MTTMPKTTFVETRHVLSDDERQIEQTVLAGIHQLFSDPAGNQRETYDTLIARTPIADGVTLEAIDRDGVSGWWVRPAGAPADRAILFLHGGGYVLGSAKAYRGLASQVAVRAGVAVFVAEYPLAPEHVFPAASEAAAAVRGWLGSQGVSEVALVGDSAGGGLALSVLGDTVTTSPAITAIAVFSPWLDLAMTGASVTSPDIRDPIFFQPEMLGGPAAAYLAGADPKDGRASPLYAVPDVLPPLLIQVGSDEILLDDARRYAQAAADKGGEVQLDIFEGLHHVFQGATRDLPAARRALDAAAAFLNGHWA